MTKTEKNKELDFMPKISIDEFYKWCAGTDEMGVLLSAQAKLRAEKHAAHEMLKALDARICYLEDYAEFKEITKNGLNYGGQ